MNPAPTFQWKLNGNTIANAAASSYTIGSVSLSDSGTYTVTVSNSVGTITSQPALLTVNYAPAIITQPVSQTLYLGKSTTFSVVAKGNPAPSYVWRKNGTIITSATSSSHTISSPGINDSGKYTVTVSNSLGTVVSDTARFYAVVKIASAGNNHSLFVKTDGSLWACGDNSSGQLCDGTNSGCSTPKQVMTNVQTATAGYNFTLIVKTNGELQTCGAIGGSSPITLLSNVQNVASYAGGGGHILILQADGTLSAFGTNTDGQLGDSTTTDRSNPVTIMTDVQNIAAGYNFSLAVKTDGSLWVWGANDQGQIGDSSTTGHLKPVKNTKISGPVKSIAAGYAHSLILMNDGTLLGCGANYAGQLGPTIVDFSIPAQITTGVKSMSAGQTYSHILKIDGKLWGSGSNSMGALGTGDPATYFSSVEIKPGGVSGGVQEIVAGDNHSIIIKIDGSAWTTGYNGSGQLGNGQGSGTEYGFGQISF